MKTTPYLVLFPALLLLLGRPATAETVKASLAVTRGEVTVNGAKPGKTLPAPLKVGSVLKSGINSGAILLPVPGQTVFVGQNTEVEIKASDMTAGENSAWTRRSSCSLTKGHLHCSIAQPKAGASHLNVVTPKGTLSAHGTSWATWADQMGTQAVVFAGVVTIPFGGMSVEVLYGQVATLTGEGDDAVLEVLDLKSGRFVRYTKGSTGHPGLATAAQIKVARDLLEQGFGAFRGTASAGEVLSFSQIVAAINKVLTDNLLAPINPPFEWQLWPDWYKLAPRLLPPDPINLRNLQSAPSLLPTASSEQPPN